jgi:uncharacterized protein YndB with AHSA1/START domain
VPFIVQARERATMLVVVPAITWLGTDPVDDPPLRDGMPDTLDRPGGDRVRWPRVFAGEDGRPAGFSSQVAPLLRYLDRHRIRYDLTSDLDLALSDAPRASDRKAVLLAGSLRWVSRPLARRLRRYAQDGGHLATFGPDTLRRGVTLRANGTETAGELLRPTQPSSQDPFGARLDPLRRAKSPEPLEQLGGDPAYGLFEGTTGTIEGMDAREGGGFRAVLRFEHPDDTKTTDDSDASVVTFVELVPGRLVVQRIAFETDEERFRGDMLMTWRLEPVAAGTRVTVSATDVPPGIAQDDHEVGLGSSLANLARYLER